MGHPGGLSDEEARSYVENKFQFYKFTQGLESFKRKKMKEVIFQVKKKFKPLVSESERSEAF